MRTQESVLYRKCAIICVLENMVCNAIVPMNVSCTIYDKSVIFRQLFAPRLLVSVNSPIVTIESAPKNCFFVLVQELLGNNTIVIGFNIHYTHGIITFASDGNGISADNIEKEIFVYACNTVSNSLNIAFNGKVRFITAIIFTKSPVRHKFIAVKECVSVSCATKVRLITSFLSE